MAIEINDANFKEVVVKSGNPVVIDFWAEWCGPCRMIAPYIEELSKEYQDRVVVGKVNVDENPEISEKLSIRNIPTILFFNKGEMVDKQVGVVPKPILVQKIEAML